MTTQLTLPELGENIQSGELLKVLVSVGDTVAADQPVLELETDKATIEVPALVSGEVKEILVKPGETVAVGQPILTVEELGAGTPSKPARGEAAAEAPQAGQERIASEKSRAEGGQEVLTR